MGVVLGDDLAVHVAGELGASPLAVEVGLDGHVCGGCVEVTGEGLVEWCCGFGEGSSGKQHFQEEGRGSSGGGGVLMMLHFFFVTVGKPEAGIRLSPSIMLR